MRHINYSPKKRFGQNFLHDPAVISRIVSCICPKASDHLVEIGPGLGALTTHILPQVLALDVIEIDRHLIPELQKNCAGLGELRLHQTDALVFDFAKLNLVPLRIIGNLPYNIATPLLFHLLNNVSIIQDMHFMLQLEVAERLAAKPGTKNYGRLSVMVQYFCQVELLFRVGSGAFFPAPKVDSAFVELIPHEQNQHSLCDIKILSEVTRQAFGQRRKTIANSLKKLITAQSLKILDIDPTLRAENLGLKEFIKICNNCKCTLESQALEGRQHESDSRH